MWKAINDSLPTRRNLARRKVVESPNCLVCENDEKSICHAMWSCSAAGDVWAKDSNPLQKWSGSEDEMFSAREKMVLNLPHEELELVAIVMRKIWLKRNACL